MRRARDQRSILVISALLIEAGALAFWPTLYLVDSRVEPSPLGEMIRRRFGVIGPLTDGVKSLVDWFFPGVLWSWEQLAAFFFHILIASFLAYGIAAWTVLRSGERDNAPSVKWVVIPLLFFQTTLFFTPATLTTDIYNYAIYGEMPVVYGANPFLSTPGEFPQSTLYYLVPQYWHDAPSVYGPLWIDLSVVVAAVFQNHALIHEILAYRLIATLAHLANTLLIWRIATRLRPATAVSAALAYGWNPSALMEFAFNGHNDALMLTLLLGAVLLGLTRPSLSALSIAGSIALKYTSVLVAPLLLLWTAAGSPLSSPGGRLLPSILASRRRMLVLLASGIIALGTVVLLYVPWFEGIDTFGPVLYWATGPRLQNYWPEPVLITLTAWSSGLLAADYGDVWAVILPAFKNVARLALLTSIAWEAWRARDLRDVLAGSSRIWIVFLLLVNTWIMPWYYLWPLAMAASLGWGTPIVRICAGLTLTAPLIMYGRQLNFAPIGELAGVTLILPILLWGIDSLFHAKRALRESPFV